MPGGDLQAMSADRALTALRNHIPRANEKAQGAYQWFEDAAAALLRVAFHVPSLPSV